MIRKILVERFGLQLHHEQREMAVFALTVAKGGPRMIANTSDPNGWMEQQNGGTDDRHVEALRNASMADLALILQFHVDRPVVDQTGLKGRYDLKLHWTLDDAAGGARCATGVVYRHPGANWAEIGKGEGAGGCVGDR